MRATASRLDRSTLADWVGQSTALIQPLIEALRRDVMASEVLHGDDTPVPVLAPGAGQDEDGQAVGLCPRRAPARGKTPPAAALLLLTRPQG